jgi:quercetin dioxygenase-like cupin family protein
MAPNDRYRLGGKGAEHAVFVIGGEGTFTAGGESDAAGTGTALTILRNEEVEIVAGDGGLELFVVTLDA